MVVACGNVCLLKVRTFYAKLYLTISLQAQAVISMRNSAKIEQQTAVSILTLIDFTSVCSFRDRLEMAVT